MLLYFYQIKHRRKNMKNVSLKQISLSIIAVMVLAASSATFAEDGFSRTPLGKMIAEHSTTK